MERQIIAIGSDASLFTVARRMRDHTIGCLPVVEANRPVGMITDRDLVVRGLARSLAPLRARRHVGRHPDVSRRPLAG